MVASNFVNGLPLWALYIITAAIVLLSIELGWRLGNYRRQHLRKRIRRLSMRQWGQY